ncbi:MAG: hypothetical protein J5I90_20970 [Caldilineales bacterium]|nr:hypothetical protein [Caldilineales bacterium]
MNSTFAEIESQRLALQASIDEMKTQEERNRMGQFATPPDLAEDMLRYALSLTASDQEIHFLDPAIGTGSFFSALVRTAYQHTIREALGFEIDTYYGEPAIRLWQDHGLKTELADFTEVQPSPRFNIITCNPPYVRHHHLAGDDKKRLQSLTRQVSGMKLSGLAGLYCYFMGLTHAWMSTGAIAGWLIPSEFMDVNYGEAVKKYLLQKVTLVHIHRFDPHDVQFADALVSSAIVWLKNIPPPIDHEVKMTFGGTLQEPEMTRQIPAQVLANEAKWTRFPTRGIRDTSEEITLSDLFHIKRGIATGDNKFFILSEKDLYAKGLPLEMFTPVLPSPRYLHENVVRGRLDGSPQIERRLFLLNTKLPISDIQSRFPMLFAYLEEGRERGVHERYLCRHRSPWYSQEDRPAAPLLCTYIGRRNANGNPPFRFILNESTATVVNVYLAMYPKLTLRRALDHDRSLLRRIWERMNRINHVELIDEGRVYGGGLYKIEPRELGEVDAGFILDLLPHNSIPLKFEQLDLFEHLASGDASLQSRMENHVASQQ